jgi:hypothetical protein
MYASDFATLKSSPQRGHRLTFALATSTTSVRAGASGPSGRLCRGSGPPGGARSAAPRAGRKARLLEDPLSRGRRQVPRRPRPRRVRELRPGYKRHAFWAEAVPAPTCSAGHRAAYLGVLQGLDPLPSSIGPPLYRFPPPDANAVGTVASPGESGLVGELMGSLFGGAKVVSYVNQPKTSRLPHTDHP